MDNNTKKTQQQLIEDLVGTIESYSDLHRVMSALDRKTKPILLSEIELKPRLDSGMFYDTLCYLLENKPTPQEAFAYTAELYNVDDDWMKIAKNTKLPPYIHKEVGSAVLKSGSGTVENIIDNELDLKGAMTTSKTPNQSVRRIHKLIKVSDRLDDLESRVGSIEKRQDTAEYLLKAVVEMSCREAIKTKAIELLRQGDMTKEEISNITGISTRTLIRYSKEM